MNLWAKLLIGTWILIVIIGALIGGYYWGKKVAGKSCENIQNTIGSPQTSGSGQNQNVITDSTQNKFADLPAEKKECLIKSLSTQAFNDLGTKKRQPSPDEQKIIENCNVEINNNNPTDGKTNTNQNMVNPSTSPSASTINPNTMPTNNVVQ